jgi:hypothetical protein
MQVLVVRNQYCQGVAPTVEHALNNGVNVIQTNVVCLGLALYHMEEHTSIRACPHAWLSCAHC